MTNSNIKRFTYLALFISIELVITMVPFLGFIPLGIINVTTLHIPVILCAILLGKKEGAILGFLFGFMSMIKNTSAPSATSFIFSPFIEIGGISGGWQSLLICFIPRMMIGYASGALFEILQNTKLNENMKVASSAIVGSLCNTLLVMGGIYIFFGKAYAEVMNISYQSLVGFIMGVITTNGIAEAIAAALLCMAVYKTAKRIVRL